MNSLARKKKRDGKKGVSQAQLQAYRARQEATLSREEVEQRREAERRQAQRREEQAVERAESSFFEGSRNESSDDDQPKLSAEYIASEYASVRQELNRIAVWGGLSFFLLAIIAVYMS